MKARCSLCLLVPFCLWLVAAVVPSPPTTVPDGPTLEAKVDAYFAPHLANRDFSGVVLIAKGNQVLLEKAYGMANYELQVPHTPRSKFRIGSLTKTFTAAAIVMLAEEGKLRYSDPLTKYIPDFPNGERITVLHLLAHQSGVGQPKEYATAVAPTSLEQLVQLIKQQPAQFAPGTQTRYSNAGYGLLAFIVQKASGMPYAEFLQQRILAPLEMRETGHFAEKEITPQRATGYIPGPWPSGLFNAPREDLHFAIGSGSLYSTAADLHRWAVAVQSEKLYKRSSLVYPFGWGRVDNSVRKGLNQTGLMTGFTSSLSLYFEHDLYVVCLSNIEYGEGLRWSEDIAAIALGRPYQIATVRQPATTPLQQPSRFAGRYRDKELTLVLQERAGHLWMGYNDGPTEQYLMPLASGEFANRANAGTLKFLEEKENHFTTLIWTYGTGPGRRFERVQP